MTVAVLHDCDPNTFSAALTALGRAINLAGGAVTVRTDYDINSIPGVLKTYATTINAINGVHPDVEVLTDVDVNSISAYIEVLATAVNLI